MNDIDDLLNLKDLGLITALVTSGHQPVGTRQDESGRVYFMFIKTHETQTAIDNFWAHTLQVDSRSYSDTMKALKAEIYNQRSNDAT